jgi:hypothetical protein
MTFAELPVGRWFYLYQGSQTKYLKLDRKNAVVPPKATRWQITPDSVVKEADPPKEFAK